MDVIIEQNFLKSAKRLPAPISSVLAKKILLLSTNPYHPLLHTKKLTGNLKGFLSFRITRDWRVIFYFMGDDSIHLLDVGHRKEVYK